MPDQPSDIMRRIARTFLLCVILAPGLATPAKAGPPPRVLDVFDATSLLKFDTRNADERRVFWDQMHALSALQGLVNRESPRLYLFLVGEAGRIDHYWLDLLRQPGQWLAGCQLRERHDLVELVKSYRKFIKGVVVWDDRVPATALVASTAAGVADRASAYSIPLDLRRFY